MITNERIFYSRQQWIYHLRQTLDLSNKVDLKLVVYRHPRTSDAMVALRVNRPDGQKCTLGPEPVADFPSDSLKAQLMLAAA